MARSFCLVSDGRKPHLACRAVCGVNPVRAGQVTTPQEWLWSSAACHISGTPNVLVVPDVLTPYITDWASYFSESESDLFRKHERTGRPLGSEDFIMGLESRFKRTLMPQKPGPKPKTIKDPLIKSPISPRRSMQRIDNIHDLC